MTSHLILTPETASPTRRRNAYTAHVHVRSMDPPIPDPNAHARWLLTLLDLCEKGYPPTYNIEIPDEITATGRIPLGAIREEPTGQYVIKLPDALTDLGILMEGLPDDYDDVLREGEQIIDQEMATALLSQAHPGHISALQGVLVTRYRDEIDNATLIRPAVVRFDARARVSQGAELLLAIILADRPTPLVLLNDPLKTSHDESTPPD